MTGAESKKILLIEPEGARQALVLMALLEAFPEAVVEPVATCQQAIDQHADATARAFDLVLVSDAICDRDLTLLLQHGAESFDSRAVACYGSQREDGLTSIDGGWHVEFMGTDDWMAGYRLRRRILEISANSGPTSDHLDRSIHGHFRGSDFAMPVVDGDVIVSMDELIRRVVSRPRRINHRHGIIVLQLEAGVCGRASEPDPTTRRAIQQLTDYFLAHTGIEDIVGHQGGARFTVLKSSCTLSSAVSWSERLGEHIRENVLADHGHDNPNGWAIGLAFDDWSVPPYELIDRAASAVTLAAKRSSNRIATWEMVRFHEAVGTFNGKAVKPDTRLQRLLDAWSGEFGPTQGNHLTTHARFVSGMAVRLGRSLGFKASSLERLRVAGLCHDIGKLLIPESVLAKSSRLTHDERSLLRRHAEDGADMAKSLGVDEQTADFIRYHHTRYEEISRSDAGTRLSDVPLGAQILAVADALVTMTSHRPYMRARTFDDAICELRHQRGRQFSPRVVDALPAALTAE